MRSHAWVSLKRPPIFSTIALEKVRTTFTDFCLPLCRNTHSTASGVKTRSFQAIFSELESALQIHRAHGSYLGGMHLELTGDAVTECVGGSEGLEEADLSLNYTTYCDPRLNEKQALELAFLVADHYRTQDDDGDDDEAMM